MFKNKSKHGKNNICGRKIYALRKAKVPRMSQRMLAERLQLEGIDIDKNAIQRIEAGFRFVTDIEIIALCNVFNVTFEELISTKIEE